MKRKCLKMLVCGLTTAMLLSGLVGCSGCKEARETVTSETIVSEEVSEEVSEDLSVEASEESTEEVKEEVSETPGEEKPSETENPSEETKPAYTVEAMTATMYAQRAVNVRKGPGTEYEKIGSLSLNQEVAVTGKASTGWYEISYNGMVGYVAGSYLGTEKVEEQPAPATPPAENTTPPAESTPATPPASTPVEPAPSTPATPAVPSQPTAPAEVTYEVYLNTDMLGLVNGHRVNNGVKEVVWASDREQEALDRAKVVAQTFQQTGQLSHAGIPSFARCENLACSYGGGDSSSFYNQYANSSGHNANMLTQDNSDKQHSMVSATCKISNGVTEIYVNVMLFYT